MAQRNLRGGRRRRRASPRARPRAGRGGRRGRGLAAGRERDPPPLRRELGVHAQSRRLHAPRRVGLRGLPGRRTRCCCTTPTSSCTASRWSSRPTSCSRCTCAATPSTAEQKARNFDYYEQRTVRDSSLSACTQAVMAAEVGYVELAYDYLAEAALVDLDDLNHNTRDGLHIASLAGAWIALRRRARRDARPRRRAVVRAAPAAGPVAAELPALPRAGAGDGLCGPRAGHLRAVGRGAPGADPPRRVVRARGRLAGHAAGAARAGPRAAPRSRPAGRRGGATAAPRASRPAGRRAARGCGPSARSRSR